MPWIKVRGIIFIYNVKFAIKIYSTLPLRWIHHRINFRFICKTRCTVNEFWIWCLMVLFRKHILSIKIFFMTNITRSYTNFLLWTISVLSYHVKPSVLPRKRIFFSRRQSCELRLTLCFFSVLIDRVILNPACFMKWYRLLIMCRGRAN